MTAFTQAEIADLTVNQFTDSELKEAVIAFNGFRSIFCRSWIDGYFHGAKSPIFVRKIVDTWQDYSLIKNLPNAEQITERWRSGITEQGVIAEVGILAKILRAGFEIDLFTPISKRVPDARIRLSPSQPWTYVEISQRNTSKIRKDSEAVMQRVVAKALDARPTLHSRVAILRVPNETEMTAIFDWLYTLPESGSIFRDLAMLWVEPHEADAGTHDELYQHVLEPRLFMTQIVGGETLRKATVAISITDENAETILRKEAQQLPSSEPGIVIIDTSHIIGGTDAWKHLIERRLQPTINTRIGAVILTQSLYGINGQEAESIIIKNCHAANSIDDFVIQKLRASFPAKS